MAGPRRNYTPIWERLRFLNGHDLVQFPVRLWWGGTEHFCELVAITEDGEPRVRLSANMQELFRTINWTAIRAAIKDPKDWANVERRKEDIAANLNGFHSPHTLAMGALGPLLRATRAVHAYNFAEQFCVDGDLVKSAFPELCSGGDPVEVEYRATSLYFRRRDIDPLHADQKFRIRTPFGCFTFSKKDFETVFANVATNEKSYQTAGSYSYTIPPSKAQPFRDFDPTKIDSSRRYTLFELLDLLIEHDLVSESSVAAQDDGDNAGRGTVDEEDSLDLGDRGIATDIRYSSRNVILFGPPGTGKSYRLKTIFLPGVGINPNTDHDRIFRVTFHPEMTYFDFVGSYKPLQGRESTSTAVHGADGREMHSPDGSLARPVVYYGFEPGPFTDALVMALQNSTANVALIIEEINRGNCAAIFGDIFQLLDRTQDQHSEFAIKPSTSLASHLGERLQKTISQLQLPPNLFIYATMNTSDQSLFPMDTAFKRRWSLEYVGIAFDNPGIRRVSVPVTEGAFKPWWVVAREINRRIVSSTGVDDKQMGPYFVRPDGGDHVGAPAFRSKVLFYLWNDVFRSDPRSVFAEGITTYDELVSQHRAAKPILREDLLSAIDAALASPPVDPSAK